MSDERFPPGGDYEARINLIGRTVDERRKEVLDTVGREGGVYAKLIGTVIRFFEAQWEGIWAKVSLSFPFEGLFVGYIVDVVPLFCVEVVGRRVPKEELIDAYPVVHQFDANDGGRVSSDQDKAIQG